MSDIINSNKHPSLNIGNEQDRGKIYNVAHAFASYDRIKILNLLALEAMNIYEIAKRLNMPISTVSNHISILEEAQIIFVSTQQGAKKHVKMCSKQINEITFQIYVEKQNIPLNTYMIEMPVGHFTEANIMPPCGLYTPNTEHKIPVDSPIDFFSPSRFNAELLWFDHGFISYKFPNHLYQKSISKLEFSFELCSEAIYHRFNWPSDITIKINDIEALMFISPGDFGGRRGNYSPKDWSINSTQYGQLYKVTVDKNGTHLNGVLVAKNTIEHFNPINNPHIKLSFGVKHDAVHRGGLNLFGKNFGDYNQSIVLTLYP